MHYVWRFFSFSRAPTPCILLVLRIPHNYPLFSQRFVLSIERNREWRQVSIVARRPFALSNDRRKVWATVLFLECYHAQERHVNFFVFLPYLQDRGLFRSRNFATMTTWRNNFSFLLLLRCHSVILRHCIFQREKQERQQQQRTVKSKLREKRQISARARRYYDEYEVRMRARMLKRRTREEQVRKITIFAFHLMK